MARVRVALDIDVTKGDVEKIAEVIFNNRDKAMDFITSVILVNDEETHEFRTKGVGGNTHIHSDNPDDYGRCDECVRYSGRVKLAKVED